MRKLLLGLALLGLVGCGDGETETASKDKWYEGGTLHKATLQEWIDATPENRLATAADWSFAMLGEDKAMKLGLDGLKIKAQEVVSCLNEFTSDDEAVAAASKNNKIAEFAVMCRIMMDG